ncbi:MAG TPA: HAD family hydrolase [Candidatus Binataceae bacterium]|nr:HAD family hydrolase [Candidatus Binataceae bacterium]
MTSPTRGLLFDFGGTLDHPHHWLDRFLRHYRQAGIELSRADLDAAYAHATRTAYAADAPLHRRGLHELLRFLVAHQFDHLRSQGPAEVRERLLSLNQRSDRVAERIAADFAEESAHGLARSRDLMRELSREFKLGVVSNFYGNLEVILVEAGIRELIQVAIDSKHLGIFKPDERIFVAALKALDLPHNRVAVVGDSLHKDCAPARKLGMHAIWLRAGRTAHAGATHEREAAAIAHQTIDSLEDLKDLKWETAESAAQ